MKCQACNSEISENFKASIYSNFCPFCGKDIMSTQQVQVKKMIVHTITTAVARNPSLKNLDSIESIDTLASVLTEPLTVFSSADTVVPAPLSSVPTPVPLPPPSSNHTIPSPVLGSNNRKSSPEIPPELRPKNIKPVPKISREGMSSREANPMVLSDESMGSIGSMNLEDLNGLATNLLDELPGGDVLSELDDSAFFNAGTSGSIVRDVDGEDVLFGVSDPSMSALAQSRKQRYQENKQKGLLGKVSKPVSRVG